MPRISPKTPQIPKFSLIAKKLSKVARDTAVSHVRLFAWESRDNFREQIELQNFLSFEMFPLSRAWLEKKREAGADLRTMIATTTYISLIRVRRKKQGRNKWLFRVGFGPHDMAVDLEGNETDTPLDTVARAHEYGVMGTGLQWKIPPRRHWGPYLEHMRGFEAPRVRREMRKAIWQRWKRKGLV